MANKTNVGEIPKLAKYLNEKYHKVYRLVSKGHLDDCIKNGKINKKKAAEVIKSRVAPIQKASAEARWNKKKNPTQEDVADVAAVAGLDENTSIAEAQRLKAVYDASIRKLELEQRRSDLLEFEAVKKEVGNIVLTFRSQVVSIPDRISAILAAESSRSEVKRLLKAELNTALDAISSKLLEPDD